MAKKEQTKKEEKKIEKNNVHTITVKIENEEWKEALDKTFTKKQKTAKVDGFRPGKVPRNIYEKHFGKESLYLDAADLVLPKAYTKALNDSNLIPIIQPTVNLKSIDETKVEFIFTITTKPEMKIKKYKGLNIKREKVEVTDEEIDHEIGHILERFTELQVKEDGTVEKGNIAIIDFEGFKEGVAFEGGKGENYSLEIGSNTFIPGFEEQLIGMKVGEEKELNLTFPEDYGAKDLAGAAVVFKVKVNEIKEKKNREFDEDFFEDLGMEGVTSEKTLKEEVEKSIKSQKEVEVENKHIDALLEAISKNVEVNVPEEMVEEEVNHMLSRFEEQMKMQGISLELYYQITKSSEKDLKSQMEKEAYSNVLYRLMLEEIMNLEKITVTEEEIEKEIKDLSAKYKMEEDKLLEQFGGKEMIKYDLEMHKTIELLKEANK